MAHIGNMDNLPQDDLYRVEEQILKATTDEEKTLVANAALMVGVATALLGGATKEQVKEVVLAIIEALPGEHSN